LFTVGNDNKKVVAIWFYSWRGMSRKVNWWGHIMIQQATHFKINTHILIINFLDDFLFFYFFIFNNLKPLRKYYIML